MKIGFLISPSMLVTSMTNAYELMFAAIQSTKALSRTSLESPTLVKVGAKDDRISMPSGLSLATDKGLDKEVYDMIYLPAIWRNPRPVIKSSQAVVNWIRYQYKQGAIINSTGTGVCWVAEAGLLDNQPAVLERVLQVVRYRQFHLEALQMQPDGQDKLTVNMKVSSQQSINILTSQLNKLYDLARLSIQHEMPLKATA